MKLIYKYSDKINLFLGSLIFLFPILPFNTLSQIAIVFSVSSLFLFWRNGRQNFRKMGISYLLVNVSFYILLIFSLLYSQDKVEGIQALQSSLVIILFPLIFIYFQPKTSFNNLSVYALVFLAANALFTIYIGYYLIHYSVLGCYIELSELSWLQKLVYLRDRSFSNLLWCARSASEGSIFIHKVYNATSLVLACYFILHLIINKRFNWGFRAVLWIAFIYFTLFIFYLYSLVNIVMLVIGFIVAILYYIKKSSERLYKITVIITIALVIVCALMISSDKLNYIYKEIRTEKQYDGILERGLINKCNFPLLKENFMFGVGVGDVQGELNQCYISNFQSNAFYLQASRDNINSHNYYFYLILSGGVLPFLAFVCMVAFNFKLCYKSNYYPYALFILLIAVNLATENMLSRMYGAVLFSAFNALFVYRMIQNGKLKDGG